MDNMDNKIYAKVLLDNVCHDGSENKYQQHCRDKI